MRQLKVYGYKNVRIKPILLLAFLLTFFWSKLSANDAQKKIDGLIELAETTTSDSVKLSSLLDISYFYQPLDTTKMWEYYHKTVDFAKQVNRLDMVASAHLDIGNWYYYMGDIDEAELWYLKSIKVAHQNNDLLTELLAWLNIADLESTRANYVRQIEIVDSCLEVALENDIPDVAMPCYGLYGLNFWRLGEYDKAMEFTFKSLELAEELGWGAKVLQLHNNIGLIYRDREEFDKALMHLKKSMQTSYFVDPETYNHIGRIYLKQSQFELASIYFDSCESIAIERNNYDVLSGVLNSKGELAIAQNELLNAKGLLKKAEKCIEDKDQKEYLARIYLNLSKVYRLLNQNDSASYFANKAIERSLALDEKESLAQGYLQLSEAFQSIGNFEKGLDYFEKYNEVKNSILNEKRLKNISVVEIKYETAKKDLEIERNRQHLNTLQVEKQEFQLKMLLILGGVVLVVGALMATWKVISTQKERKMQQNFAKHVLQSQETERKRIAADLHDSIGQNLLLIKGDSTIQKNEEVKALVSDALDEVRSISRGLHPVQLERLGLTAAIEEMVDKVDKIGSLFISDEIEPIDGLLDETNEIHVYRVIQESLNNIIKHSKADSAKVMISKLSNSIRIEIQDNGVGFDYTKKLITGKSIGLTSLNERTKYLNGEFSVKSDKASGTVVTFVIPIG